MSLDFELGQEQRMVRDGVRALLRRFEPRRAELRHAMHRREFPTELWNAVADAGFMGAMIPEAYGGSDMGLLSMCLLSEEMAAFGVSHPLFALTSMDALCLVRGASEEMKRAWLPEIAAGRCKLAFAVTEADAGTNTFRIATRAERDGDSFVLTGEKQWITAADCADYILVVARTTSKAECDRQGLPKAWGMTLFLLDPRAPGVTLHELQTGSIEGARQFTVAMDRARVPAEHVVGEIDQGAMTLFLALNPERVLIAATICGVAELCLRTACDYANERRVFRGVPIGQYQAIQHPLAQIRIQQEATRLMTWKAATSFDRGDDLAQTGVWTNMAKYMASELGVAAVDRAIQTLGGNGFSQEYGLIQLWEGMRLFKTAPISNEMILNFIAEHELGLPRSY
jgi:alkylation response protein AidB-like acyl-CoA dehydrogenase